MLDIIILAEPNHKKLSQTLSSIAIQNEKVTTYIIINSKVYNCQKEIKLFGDYLNLKVLDIEYDKEKLGIARNYAINNTDNNYLLFLNAGDQLFDCYSLKRINNDLNKDNNYELILGKYYINYDNHNKEIINNPSLYANLYGKIFNRSFIKKNSIHFNHTKYKSEDSFYTITITLAKKIKELDFFITTNINESQLSQLDNIIYFLHNRLWTIKELNKRNILRDNLCELTLNSFLYVFQELYENMDDKYYDKLYKYCRNYEKLLSSYDDLITEQRLFNNIQNIFSTSSFYTNILANEFKHFRNKFKGSVK